ncbi:MAG: hypothetical protein AAF514_18750 [Verrucomicrobiota bacterium]
MNSQLVLKLVRGFLTEVFARELPPRTLTHEEAVRLIRNEWAHEAPIDEPTGDRYLREIRKLMIDFGVRLERE